MITWTGVSGIRVMGNTDWPALAALAGLLVWIKLKRWNTGKPGMGYTTNDFGFFVIDKLAA